MTEPKKIEHQVTETEWTWNCPDCGIERQARHKPLALRCHKCQETEEYKAAQERWKEYHPELIGATVVGGTVDFGEMKSIIVETKDGQRARLEIELGWEGGDEQLVVAWEDNDGT